jgi:centromere/kinetochore protein ZW10
LTSTRFTYNDSIWLCDKLEEFQSDWDKRTDLAPRAYGKVKLDPEIKNLRSFGKRAYTNELNAQRTVITDLLGGRFPCPYASTVTWHISGSQNFFQQDGSLKGELEADIKNIVKHIRTAAASWKPILAYSAWASSVGALVNGVASKIITDVFDLNDVSVDEAERLATLISRVLELDDLFLPPTDPKSQIQGNNGTNGEGEPIPMTAQFADKWMKLNYLSEVLQSNLRDINWFWFNGELSIYFSADEVVELIGLSFENNANVRQAIREIRERPRPLVPGWGFDGCWTSWE